jgi:acetyl esterase/lipase
MDIYDRMDPELATALRAQPFSVRSPDLQAVRAGLAQLAERWRINAQTPVAIEDRTVAGAADHPALKVRLYRPAEVDAPLGTLLWIHGGGYTLGTADMSDRMQADMALAGKCLIVSVDYRLAPEHPYPAAIEDCYAALKWLVSNAGALGVDPDRIAIGGQSAGGGLAAALALLARDRAEVKVNFQLLMCPMLDDRNSTLSSHAITMEGVFNREANLAGWGAYLGRAPGGDDVSPYAAPSRATDLNGLPPAYLFVGDLDLFLDEDIDYAHRLLQAGVPTELHVYAGAFHGFEVWVPDAQISLRCMQGVHAALERHLASPPRAPGS